MATPTSAPARLAASGGQPSDSGGSAPAPAHITARRPDGAWHSRPARARCDSLADRTAIDAGGLVPDLHHRTVGRPRSRTSTHSRCSRCSSATPRRRSAGQPAARVARRQRPPGRSYIVNVSAMEGVFGPRLQGPRASAHQHGQGCREHLHSHQHARDDQQQYVISFFFFFFFFFFLAQLRIASRSCSATGSPSRRPSRRRRYTVNPGAESIAVASGGAVHRRRRGEQDRVRPARHHLDLRERRDRVRRDRAGLADRRHALPGRPAGRLVAGTPGRLRLPGDWHDTATTCCSTSGSPSRAAPWSRRGSPSSSTRPRRRAAGVRGRRRRAGREAAGADGAAQRPPSAGSRPVRRLGLRPQPPVRGRNG